MILKMKDLTFIECLLHTVVKKQFMYLMDTFLLTFPNYLEKQILSSCYK